MPLEGCIKNLTQVGELISKPSVPLLFLVSWRTAVGDPRTQTLVLGNHQSSSWIGFRTYLWLTLLLLGQQDLPILSALGGGGGTTARTPGLCPPNSRTQHLDQILPTTPSAEQSKVSLVLKGRWPGSHLEETAPTEYNG